METITDVLSEYMQGPHPLIEAYTHQPIRPQTDRSELPKYQEEIYRIEVGLQVRDWYVQHGRTPIEYMIFSRSLDLGQYDFLYAYKVEEKYVCARVMQLDWQMLYLFFPKLIKYTIYGDEK